MAKRGRPKVKKIEIEEKNEILSSPSSLNTTLASPYMDRMMAYKKVSCDQCGESSFVTEQKNREIIVRRCRVCGFRFEEVRRLR